MIFAIRNLSVLSYAQGFTFWHYRGGVETLGATLTGPVTLAEVAAPGFFAPAQDMLTPGDMITVSAKDGGAILFVQSTAGGVTTVPMAATAARGECGPEGAV